MIHNRHLHGTGSDPYFSVSRLKGRGRQQQRIEVNFLKFLTDTGANHAFDANVLHDNCPACPACPETQFRLYILEPGELFKYHESMHVTTSLSRASNIFASSCDNPNLRLIGQFK